MAASTSVEHRQRRMSSASTTAVATLLPLGLVMLFFFVVPLLGMAVTSVQAPGGGVSLEHYESLASGRRWLALRNSIFISTVSSLLAAVVGTIIAWGISHINSRILNAVTGVLSSVLANSGGAALAFSFIVLFGNAGYLISFITGMDSGFTLYSSKGLVLMYQYFLIPTMVLLLLPSMQALRTEWKEANTSLGGSQFVFWRKIGIPILSPAIIGGFVLLFGSAFATHASAAVLLGSGAFPLITLQIANELGGTAAVCWQNAAMAMGLVTAVVAIVVLIVFNLLQGRSQKWLQR